MNGLLNLPFPLFDALDALIAFLPAGLRVALFGVASGIITMGLYRWSSNQEKIRRHKEEIGRIRRRLAAAGDDLGETMRLSRANLAASFRLLGTVTGPALLASLPILLVIVWVAARYGYEPPPPASPVAIAFEPGRGEILVEPQGALEERGEGLFLRWPASAGEIRFRDAKGVVYAGPPPVPANDVVHKPLWWNLLLGNEMGYLRKDAAIEAIRFELAPRRLLPGLPGWLAGWEAIYFASLLATSLLLKLAFRIE